MPEEKPIIRVNANPILYYATGVNLVFGEEEFFALITFGNQAMQFAFSPKHMKRLSMLLEKSIKEYEIKFGKLETKLPEAKKESSEKNKIGFGL